MKLIDFWPTDDQDHIGDCFFTDADSAKEAVFLAVHQPMQVVRENFRSKNVEPVLQNEEQVLQSLLKRNPANGTLILPIVGDSGVGKSHLIRWLHAHLKLRKDGDSRHIVRIPKSASLRTVLNSIFKELPETTFDDLRVKISQVQLPEDRQKAAWSLQTNLIGEIESLGKLAKERDRNPEKRKPLDSERKSHCTRDCLIALLQDPLINRHFTEVNEVDPTRSGVLARIAERCVEGSLDSTPEFELKDFDFLTRIENEKDLARPTRDYIRMLRAIGGLKHVVTFLNEVVDAAVGGLVKTGGDSLADILGQVRERLFAEGKELILLVEDYAVLTGVQEPFRAAMVQDASDENGEQIRCVLRTAFAITEGSQMVETVMTRANTRWLIKSHPFQTREEALTIFQNFVGGYLNAARLGSARLAEAFSKRKSDTDWVPDFFEDHEENLSDEDRFRLKAFGFSPAENHPLFPLNPGAIEQLAIAHLGENDNRFRFDPRLLINRLLLDPLKDGRKFFASGKFPPPSFHPQFKFEKLNRDVGTVLNHQIASDELQRSSLLVYFWGNNPVSTGHAAALSSAILQTFALPIVDWGAKSVVTPVSLPKREPAIDARPEKKEEEPVEGRQASIFLERWRQDATIIASNANSVRQWIVKGVNDFLDVNSMLKTKLEVTWRDVYLPRASQSRQEADEALIVVGREEDLDESPGAMLGFFDSMIAIARFNQRGDWDYDGGESDFVRYANLIESLSSVAEKHFRANGASKSFPNTGIRPLAQALMLNARILDIDGASSDKYEDNLRAMLAPAPNRVVGMVGPGANQDRWEKLRENARSSRGEMRDLLLTSISARQGRGEPQAVDAAELLSAVSQLKNEQNWVLEADLGFDRNALETGGAREHVFNELTGSLRNIVNQRQDILREWRDRVTGALGDSFNLEETKAAFRELLTKAVRVGVYRYRTLDPDPLNAKIRDLEPVKTLLGNAVSATSPDMDFGQVLTALSRLENDELKRVLDVIGHYEKFLEAAEAEVKAILSDTTDSLDDSATSLDTRFDSFSRVWEEIATLSES